MIVIITSERDQHADYVSVKLGERGVEFIRFDPGHFPRDAEISISYCSTKSPYCILRTSNTYVDLYSIRSIWFRRPDPPAAHRVIRDELARQLIAEECNTFMQDLWNSMECLWVPGTPIALRRAGLKAGQLRIAQELGFSIPPTLITTHYDDLLEFYREHNGNIVNKLVGNAFSHVMGHEFVRYTEVVPTQAMAHARSIRYCPMIFQACIPKRVELRITIVDDAVFSAEIHSQVSNHTRVDWRRYDEFQTPYFPHQLPIDIERLCVSLVRKLGLRYGAIDMIITPEGEYIFLEINPNGQYLWIEQTTGLPITDALCDLLIMGTPRHLSVPGNSELGDHI